MRNIAISDILPSVKRKIYIQDYTPQTQIVGVKTYRLKNIVLDDGDFNELMRFGEGGELDYFPEFKIKQINRTQLIPGSVKAWHLHYKQDEIWYVSPADHLLVGLWDVRKKSKSKDTVMRFVLGGGHSQLLYIPRGVAHGSSVVVNKPIELYVFLNRQFDIKKPDERRINWDAKGKEFWETQKDINYLTVRDKI